MHCFFLLVCVLSSSTCSELMSRHKRAWIIDSFTLEEAHPGPFPYELGKIHIDRKYQVNFDLLGKGVDQEPKGVLSIDRQSGMVSVHKAVDYEEHTKLSLRFESRKTDSSIDTNLGVEINILDINDNPPRFLSDLYEININEDKTQGSHLLTFAAFDIDQSGTLNSTFHYEIKSVSPDLQDTKFYIDELGTLSFKGCLDHEVAEMITVLVEAKDHGEVISLSSSTTVILHIQDGNNHLPTISEQTGSGKVKEDEIGTSPLRLHVTDKDSANSAAWRVRYSIEGDQGGHFTIETDPLTNDGILTVVKPLDFEEGSHRELSISVENEAPYFSCKVREKTSSGLWKVDSSNGDDPGAAKPHSVKVVIEVEDSNDPPQFSTKVKDAVLEENAPKGTWVEKVTAVDPDSSHGTDFVYKIGSDPAGWVTVDPLTGDITTVQIPDRESPHVVNGTYTVLLHAEDNGDPPMTGTATLNIHVSDQNDNVPQLTVEHMDVCVSDDITTSDITATDPDGNPFGGPFVFELLGDVKGNWKLEPSYGYTAGLVKEPGVYAGLHTLHVKISDLQGKSGIYNLSVTACDCSVTANCRGRRGNATATAGSGAVVVLMASLLLVMIILLMSFTISCKKRFISLPSVDFSGETLIKSNIEKPGTDCQLHLPDCIQDYGPSYWTSVPDIVQQRQEGMEQRFTYSYYGDCGSKSMPYLNTDNGNQEIAKGFHHNHQTVDSKTVSSKNFLNKRSWSHGQEAAFRTLLFQRLASVQETEEDLQDSQPHLYAEEGDEDNVSELESIIHHDNSFHDALNDLGPQFSKLASICKLPHTQH